MWVERDLNRILGRYRIQRWRQQVPVGKCMPERCRDYERSYHLRRQRNPRQPVSNGPIVVTRLEQHRRACQPQSFHIPTIIAPSLDLLHNNSEQIEGHRALTASVANVPHTIYSFWTLDRDSQIESTLAVTLVHSAESPSLIQFFSFVFIVIIVTDIFITFLWHFFLT